MRKRPRRSPRFSSPLDRLATVELQLVMQSLDTNSKLKAARCSRRLLQAADHPLPWQGPPVSVTEHGRPQLGSLIRQSLLRHAPIALKMGSDLTAAEVAAIPRLLGLLIPHRWTGLTAQLLTLPSLQGLQTLRVHFHLTMPTLRQLPSLPALRTLVCWDLDDVEDPDWSWLPAMPALTDLHFAGEFYPFPQLIDAIGQCAQLQSLHLSCPYFEAGEFARLCSTPALHQLRHLKLDNLDTDEPRLADDEYRAAFSALARLESLRLAGVRGILLLLPHLARAPALRILTISCEADHPEDASSFEATKPSRDALRQLLTAAPQLEVRLQMAATIEKWRNSYWHRLFPSSWHEQIDQQWRELQRMGAELEGVTIVNK